MNTAQIVVRSEKCDFKALCRSLRGHLNDLNCETWTCRACGWTGWDGQREGVDQDDTYCIGCGGAFCHECASEARATAPTSDSGSESCEPEAELICVACSGLGPQQ